eukprot:2951821-Amphidinium_carterae.1
MHQYRHLATRPPPPDFYSFLYAGCVLFAGMGLRCGCVCVCVCVCGWANLPTTQVRAPTAYLGRRQGAALNPLWGKVAGTKALPLHAAVGRNELPWSRLDPCSRSKLI